MKNAKKKSNVWALLPIFIFLVLYISLEIFNAIEGGSGVPIIPLFLIAIAVAVLQTRGKTLEQKFALMGRGVGDYYEKEHIEWFGFASYVNIFKRLLCKKSS